MGRRHLAEGLRHPYEGRDLLIFGGCNLGARMTYEFVAGDVDFQRVHAITNTFPSHAPHFIGTIGDQPETFLMDVTSALITQPGGRRDLRAASAHAWTGDQA